MNVKVVSQVESISSPTIDVFALENCEEASQLSHVNPFPPKKDIYSTLRHLS